MSDPIELMTATIGGATVSGIVIKILTWSTQRNVAHFDQQFDRLEASVAALILKIEKVSSDVQLMREGNISTAEKQGAMAKDQELLRDRVDKLAEYWRDKWTRRTGK